LSSYFGTSRPASRDGAPLAWSVAIWTCLTSANMSGASRAVKNTCGSILRSAAFCSAADSTADSAFSLAENTGTEASYIDSVTLNLH